MSLLLFFKNNPRSAGLTPFLQETGYQPNQKKEKKKESRL
jgi:hypothetical protein